MSIEALLKRAKNNHQLTPINPLVDIYNYISLNFGFPCGGEDIDQISGDMLLIKATGFEDFITYGSDISEPPYEGELVYKDNLGVICHCLNWREGKRTILTEKTTSAILCIENIQTDCKNDLLIAIETLANQIKNELGGEVSFKILNKTNFEAFF